MKLMTSIVETNAFMSSVRHKGDESDESDDEDDAKSVMLEDLEICNSANCQNAEPVQQCTSAAHTNCDMDDDNDSVMLEDLESLQSADNSGKGLTPTERCQQSNMTQTERCQQSNTTQTERCQQSNVTLTDRCQQSNVTLTDRCQQSNGTLTDRCQQSNGTLTDRCQQANGTLTDRCQQANMTLTAVSSFSQSKSQSRESSVEPIDYSQKALSSWSWVKHAEEMDDDNKSIMLEDLESFYSGDTKQLDDKSGMLLQLQCDNDNTSGNGDAGEDATDEDINEEDINEEFYAIGQTDDDDDYLPPGKHKEPKVRIRTLKQNQYKSQKKPAKRRTRRHTPQLWVFLLNCLLDTNLNPSVIEWQDKRRGIFRLKNTKQIAQIWGQRLKKDHKKPMNYEKFSRAIRYYYHKKVILSGPGRLTYQFGPKAIGWRQVLRGAT